VSRDALKDARAEVEALAAELVSLEAVAVKHEAAAAEAARKHAKGTADAAQLQEAHAARAAIDYARSEIRRDLEAARAQVAELESAAADELLLAEIARATVEYHDAEREHHEMLTNAEQVLARGIVRSKELSRVASAARTRASDAAIKLAEKHRTEVPAMLARAVNGSEVAPLDLGATLTKWPTGRQRYRLVSQVGDKLLGVKPEGV
jgi:hypothetical protein